MDSKIAVLALALFYSTAQAATIRVKVVDSQGAPIARAAVYAKPSKPVKPAKPIAIVIDQIDKEFVKHLTVIQTGTPVSFPNHDKIRHHVYSFSPAKVFELPLYAGTPRDPVIFDKAGAVTLGCNIHDWMSAYVYVVDSPFFAETDQEGLAQLEVPAVDGYVVAAWHPDLKGGQPDSRHLDAMTGKPAELTLTLHLKPSFRAMRLPVGAGLAAGYR